MITPGLIVLVLRRRRRWRARVGPGGANGGTDYVPCNTHFLVEPKKKQGRILAEEVVFVFMERFTVFEIRVLLVGCGGHVAAVPDSPRVLVGVRGVEWAVVLTAPGGIPPPPPRTARWVK
jgi:hypothetical protein